MSVEITEEMVEAAARACAENAWAGAWDRSPVDQRVILRERMRAALESALPLIMEEAAKVVDDACDRQRVLQAAYQYEPAERVYENGADVAEAVAAALRAIKGAAQ